MAVDVAQLDTFLVCIIWHVALSLGPTHPSLRRPVSTATYDLTGALRRGDSLPHGPLLIILFQVDGQVSPPASPHVRSTFLSWAEVLQLPERIL